MAFKSFVIPVFHSEWAERELNRFLQSHRVVSVERRFVEQGSESFWAVLVDYLASSVAAGDVPTPATGSGSKKKVDYKELLSAEDFEVYLRLRDLRKDLAAEEGVMLYAVFTNEQLAQAAASRPRSKADLLKIGGIGESRAEKYGPHLLSLLNQFGKTGDETGGTTAGADR
jgi:superfamily II DNA helicase RecQ